MATLRSVITKFQSVETPYEVLTRDNAVCVFWDTYTFSST